MSKQPESPGKRNVGHEMVTAALIGTVVTISAQLLADAGARAVMTPDLLANQFSFSLVVGVISGLGVWGVRTAQNLWK